MSPNPTKGGLMKSRDSINLQNCRPFRGDVVQRQRGFPGRTIFIREIAAKRQGVISTCHTISPTGHPSLFPCRQEMKL